MTNTILYSLTVIFLCFSGSVRVSMGLSDRQGHMEYDGHIRVYFLKNTDK